MAAARVWDIFCKVIDNFGDIGVCWRLAADLASRGHQVRLWVDDASALRWMAPSGCNGVRVLPWAAAHAGFNQPAPDVLVEAFGCEIAPEFIAECTRIQRTTGQKPVWINLEYLSAEPYVERSHAMPSPVQTGPAAGWTKWFFYPGFTALTGGLLREPGLMARQAGFDGDAWLTAHGIERNGQGQGQGGTQKLVSLFCYEPPALGGLLAGGAAHGLAGMPVRLLVAAGRAENAVKTVLSDKNSLLSSTYGNSLLSISYLPLLTQPAYDELLWACDLNFVRGEDSLARALWAAKPFVWQAYPQQDDAHLTKLQAFLDWLDAPPSLRAFHAAWNGPQGAPGKAAEPPIDLAAWQSCARAARARLLAQSDLSTHLLEFVAKKR